MTLNPQPDTTAGVPTITVDTNSYVSLADANTYFAGRFGADAWTAASDADKTRGLLTAARTLDALLLKGEKYAYLQTMAFPRLLRSDRFGEYLTQPSGTVPSEVIAAQCEEALALVSGQTATPQGITSQSFGKASETYSGALVTLLSREAQVLMSPWIAGAVRIRGL